MRNGGGANDIAGFVRRFGGCIRDRRVQALPERFKIPVLMHYVAEMSVRDIASSLRLPEGTVKSRLFKTRTAAPCPPAAARRRAIPQTTTARRTMPQASTSDKTPQTQRTAPIARSGEAGDRRRPAVQRMKWRRAKGRDYIMPPIPPIPPPIGMGG
ncbi:MAG: hypothetical protein LBP73_04405, partial [Clostridiales Family XIII bacterium]|nr:hypothetical protein [Clostridiales Family XIII bacterium]